MEKPFVRFHVWGAIGDKVYALTYDGLFGWIQKPILIGIQR